MKKSQCYAYKYNIFNIGEQADSTQNTVGYYHPILSIVIGTTDRKFHFLFLLL